MGKILFLSDIHGNMPAVYALENEIKKIDIDEMWFVGDAVGKGPEGDKAVDCQFCKLFWRGDLIRILLRTSTTCKRLCYII